MLCLNIRGCYGPGKPEESKRFRRAVWTGERCCCSPGAAEGEAAGFSSETVTAGDPTFAGPLAGVQLGLTVYHICEDEIKAEVDAGVYDEQISMMEMVMDVDDIANEMSSIRDEFCKYL